MWWRRQESCVLPKTWWQVIKYPGQWNKGLEMTWKFITSARGFYCSLTLKINITPKMLGTTIAEKDANAHLKNHRDWSCVLECKKEKQEKSCVSVLKFGHSLHVTYLEKNSKFNKLVLNYLIWKLTNALWHAFTDLMLKRVKKLNLLNTIYYFWEARSFIDGNGSREREMFRKSLIVVLHV